LKSLAPGYEPTRSSKRELPAATQGSVAPDHPARESDPAVRHESP
jgi:hypothetical protein